MNNKTKIPANVRNFYTTYAPYARQTEQHTGISHLFILAQAALESGWGAHAPGNMFFGIKATPSTPAHQRQLLVTTEVLPAPPKAGAFPQLISLQPLPSGKYLCVVKDWFCKYASPAESFTAHAQLFLSHTRYAQALKVKANPYAFADAIARAGYATDPLYAQKLKQLITLLEEAETALATPASKPTPLPIKALTPLLIFALLLGGCRAKKDVQHHHHQQLLLTDTLSHQQALWRTQRLLHTSVQQLSAQFETFKDSLGHSYMKLHTITTHHHHLTDTLHQQQAHHQFQSSALEQHSSSQYVQKQTPRYPRWLYWLLGAAFIVALVRKK